MFVNLHTLPAGRHMYTAFVGTPENHDEVDFEGPANATAHQLARLATEAAAQDYPGQTVIAVANQSTTTLHSFGEGPS